MLGELVHDLKIKHSAKQDRTGEYSSCRVASLVLSFFALCFYLQRVQAYFLSFRVAGSETTNFIVHIHLSCYSLFAFCTYRASKIGAWIQKDRLIFSCEKHVAELQYAINTRAMC